MTARHAVVTGGGTGIGSAIATTLAAEGLRVTVMGRRREPLEQVVAGRDTMQALCCDVTDGDAVAEAFRLAREQSGDITVLVNCAGAAPAAPFHKLTLETWRQTLAVNLDGVFHCCQAVLGGMRDAGWGRIVNIASTAALKGYTYVSAYCAAKHGVLGLTRALALETARQGITVNAVCPGYTDTDIVRGAVADIMAKTGRSEAEAMATFTNSNPQGRLIQPSEVAATVRWLCGEDSGAITGQAISVSAGEVM